MSYHIISNKNIIFSILQMLHGNYSNGQSLQFFSIFWSSREKNTVSLFNLTQKSSGIFPERRFVAGFLWRRWRIISCTSINITPHMSIQHVSIEYVSIQRVSIQYASQFNTYPVNTYRFNRYPFHAYPFKRILSIRIHSSRVIASLQIIAYHLISRKCHETENLCISVHHQAWQWIWYTIPSAGKNLQKKMLNTNCKLQWKWINTQPCTALHDQEWRWINIVIMSLHTHIIANHRACKKMVRW